MKEGGAKGRGGSVGGGFRWLVGRKVGSSASLGWVFEFSRQAVGYHCMMPVAVLDAYQHVVSIMYVAGRRIYIPLPNDEGRKVILTHLLSGGSGKKGASSASALSARDIDNVARATAGYSASDLNALCRWTFHFVARVK